MLEHEVRNGILILRLDNPARLNAWSEATRGAIGTALDAAAAEPEIRAAVVTGTGPRAFCAGADLTDPTMGDPAAADGRMKAFLAFYRSIMFFPKPTVAALNGMALGSAFQAVLLMDARIGHSGVRFGMPEINSGMPCITGSTILLQVLGPLLARNLATTGRYVGADEASRLGLLDEIVPEDEVLPRAIAVAEALSAKAPTAYAETKAWLRDQTLPAIEEAFRRVTVVRGKEDVARGVRGGIEDFFSRRGKSATASH